MKCYIEITSKCNLKCRHCFNRGNDVFVLDKDLLKKQFILLKAMSINEITLSGGEPLMHPHFFELIDFLYKLNFKIRICTNLTLWGKEDFDKISKMNNIFINTSLDGAKKESNDLIRGQGHFNKFFEKLKLLRECNIEKCTIHCTLNRHNCSEIVDFISLVYNWNFIPMFSFTEARGNAEKYKDDLEMDKKQIFKAIIDIKRILKNDLVILGYDYRDKFCPINAKRYNLLVKSDGNISICNFLYDDKAVVGNLYETDIDKVVINEKYMKLVEKFKKFNINNCNDCIDKFRSIIDDYIE